MRRAPWRAGALAGTVLLLGTSCTIDTGADDAGGTTLPPTTTTTTTPAVPEGFTTPLGAVNVRLTEIGQFDEPIGVATRSGSESIFVGEREGVIREISRKIEEDRRVGTRDITLRTETSPLLDFRSEVLNDGERRFYSFAFSSDGRRLYVSYANEDGATQVDEYEMDEDRASVSSRREILTVAQPGDTQNGGRIVFGPDGFLYLGLGDGGGAGDPFETAQDPTQMLGSILRVDPEAGEGVAYNIPLGNPWADGEGGAREVWLTGVRNPATFAFDDETGDLWVGDIGLSRAHEVTFLPHESGPGKAANLGWPEMEGTQPFEGGTEPEEHRGPIFEYGIDVGCAVIGGHVYRGEQIPELQGAYVFGDLCQGQVRALVQGGGEVVQERFLGVGVPPALVAFGEDPDHELLVVSSSGPVFQIEPA